MARARSGGGGSGSIIGLVTFGALFFICLILAIVFYTQVDGARQEAAAARGELDQIQNSADTNDQLYESLIADGQGTTVRRLLDKYTALRSDLNDSQSEIVRLTTQLNTATTELESAQSSAETTRNQLNQANDARRSMESSLRQEVQGLSTTINAISSENDRLKSLVDTSIQQVDATYRDQITSLQEQLREGENTIASLNRNVEDLQYQLTELAGDTPESVALTSADATIVSQLPDENKVYIDIGRNANLTKGMSFRIFDPEVLIELEDADGEPGKGVVDIINVSENTAVGRIVDRSPNTVIRDGDKLVNAVYDPNRVYRFHLFGQFDVDYDGSPEENGLDQVKSMVQRFNGRVTDEVTFGTDYLVLGVEPQLPLPPDDELDIQQMNEYRVALENYNAYQDRISQARELNIPVLNQNRFFDLVGYFER